MLTINYLKMNGGDLAQFLFDTKAFEITVNDEVKIWSTSVLAPAILYDAFNVGAQIVKLDIPRIKYDRIRDILFYNEKPINYDPSVPRLLYELPFINMLNFAKRLVCYKVSELTLVIRLKELLEKKTLVSLNSYPQFPEPRPVYRRQMRANEKALYAIEGIYYFTPWDYFFPISLDRNLWPEFRRELARCFLGPMGFEKIEELAYIGHINRYLLFHVFFNILAYANEKVYIKRGFVDYSHYYSLQVLEDFIPFEELCHSLDFTINPVKELCCIRFIVQLFHEYKNLPEIASKIHEWVKEHKKAQQAYQFIKDMILMIAAITDKMYGDKNLPIVLLFLK